MTTRLGALLLLPLLALGLVACASADPGSGADTAAPPKPAQLAAAVRQATAKITSATLNQRTKVDGQQIVSTGVMTLSGHSLTGLDLRQRLPTGEQRLIIAKGTTYLSQPGVSTDPARPFVVVSAHSSNPTVRTLAGSLTALRSLTAPDASAKLLASAVSVTREGEQQLDGNPVTRYRVVIDPAKLPGGNPYLDAIRKAGLGRIPVTVFLDRQGRPVRVSESLTVQGHSVSVVADLSRFNQPVTIAAPPANRIARD